MTELSSVVFWLALLTTLGVSVANLIIARRNALEAEARLRATLEALSPPQRSRWLSTLSKSHMRHLLRSRATTIGLSGPCEQNRHGQCNVSCGCICHG